MAKKHRRVKKVGLKKSIVSEQLVKQKVEEDLITKKIKDKEITERILILCCGETEQNYFNGIN